MADRDAQVNVDDSRAVSSRSDSFSPPPDGSPPTMISDCSDLLDLINFHTTTTTSTKTATRKHKSSSHSSSSSSHSSASHSSDSDSDSGSYATAGGATNGHRRRHQPQAPPSPESALASSPATTVPSSAETTSPTAAPSDVDGSRLLELLGDRDDNHRQVSLLLGEERVESSSSSTVRHHHVVMTSTTTTTSSARLIESSSEDGTDAVLATPEALFEAFESRSSVQSHHQQEETVVLVRESREVSSTIAGGSVHDLLDFETAGETGGATYSTTTVVTTTASTLVQSESLPESHAVQWEECALKQSAVPLVDLAEGEEDSGAELEDEEFPASVIVDDDESASADIPVASAADQSDSSSSDEEDHLRDEVVETPVEHRDIVQLLDAESVTEKVEIGQLESDHVDLREERDIRPDVVKEAEVVLLAATDVELDRADHIEIEVPSVPTVEVEIQLVQSDRAVTEGEAELDEVEAEVSRPDVTVEVQQRSEPEAEPNKEEEEPGKEEEHDDVIPEVEIRIHHVDDDEEEPETEIVQRQVETTMEFSTWEVAKTKVAEEQPEVDGGDRKSESSESSDSDSEAKSAPIVVEPEIDETHLRKSESLDSELISTPIVIEPEVERADSKSESSESSDSEAEAEAAPVVIVEPEVEVVVEQEIFESESLLHDQPEAELHVHAQTKMVADDVGQVPASPRDDDDQRADATEDGADREPATTSTDLPELVMNVAPAAAPAPTEASSQVLDGRPTSPPPHDAEVELHETASSSSSDDDSEHSGDNHKQQKRRTTTSSTTSSSSSTITTSKQQNQQQNLQQQQQQMKSSTTSTKKVVQQQFETKKVVQQNQQQQQHVETKKVVVQQQTEQLTSTNNNNATGKHVTSITTTLSSNINNGAATDMKYANGKPAAAPPSVVQEQNEVHTNEDGTRLRRSRSHSGGSSSGHSGSGSSSSDDDDSEQQLTIVESLTVFRGGDVSGVAPGEFDNAPSVAELKTTYITQINEPKECEKHEKETVLTGISIKQLKASFTDPSHQQQQHHLHLQNGSDGGDKTQKFREVIDIVGVDIKSLKSSYADLSRIEDSELKACARTSRSKSFASRSQRAKSYSDLSRYEQERQREKEVIYTGVSVKALKSSFSSSDSVQQNRDFNDDDGIKIDRNKITRNFSQADCPLYALLDANEFTSVADEKTSICRICGKQVFHMERIKAEKSVFHKTCFRCQECSKPLSVDTYCSHEGVLYCRSHFRQLFQPKAKFEEEAISFPRRKHEMIIKENTPAELPPDVVRSADKPDYGLKEIPSLKNIKSRFESTDYDESDQGQLSTPVKRSESIITKMAKFQGLHSPEIGNGDDSSSSDEDMERDPEIIRESKHKKEKTTYTQSAKTQEEVVTYSGMSELKSQWETGAVSTKEERARERQEELAKLRLRICQNKGNLKAKYESACEESSIVRSPSHIGGDELHVNGEARTSSIKERFEKGDVVNDLENDKVERIQREKEEDLSVFKEQQVSSNDARNLFKQIDATTSKSGTVLNSASYNNVGVLRSPSMRSKEVLVQHTTVTDGEIVRAGDKIDEDVQAPVDLTSRFKFFQNFNDSPNQQERKRFTITPPRDDVAPKESSPEPLAARDPAVVRADDNADDLVVTDTARKMLSKFRELESQAEKGDDSPVGPKPLKRITPPREFTREGEGSPEPELPRNPDIVRACDKVEDDFLIEAHKAKSLRAKFEHWDDENEVERENRRNAADEINPNADSAKSLKAKFEALKESDRSLLDNKPKPKVNRFIDLGGGANGELCDICGNRVYSMEKLEVNNHKVHKTCFRCSHCGTVLRMDNYTTSEGVLFCTNHFKQLFIAKGNYDEGFGREQHKERWNKNSRSSTPNSGQCETQYGNSDYSDE